MKQREIWRLFRQSMNTKKNIKFYVVGLGSMGKRRIRNLLSNGVSTELIAGFDLDIKRNKEVGREYRIKTFSDFEEGFTTFHPDALIISTPPDKHSDYFLKAAEYKKHFFVEISTTSKGYDKLLMHLDGTFVAAPSCTFRNLEAIIKIKKIIDDGKIGKVLSFNHYLGQYLPDWHWYEDYKNIYFSKRLTGGCREMLGYELIWLTYLFNSMVKRIGGRHKRISDLLITADDVYAITVETESGVIGSMMIDLLNRKATRTLKIIGSNGTIDWDWQGSTISLYNNKKINNIKIFSGKKVRNYNTSEDVYNRELKTFIDATQGTVPYPYTFEEDLQILKMVERFVH